MSDVDPLTAAILAFVNEPDVPVRRRIVEANRELLLSDAADDLLAAAIAANAGRPPVRERFESCRATLADCRAIGIDPAFVLLTEPTPGLMEAVKDFLGADSADAERKALVRHRALLLSDEADWVVAALAHQNAAHAFFVKRAADGRALLARSRREGLEAALADDGQDDAVGDALRELVAALGSREAVADVLQRHRDVLLTDDAFETAERLAAAPGDNPAVQRAFSALRTVLHIARMDGISTACDVFALPPFEQFLARCFQALARDAHTDPTRRAGLAEIVRADFGPRAVRFADDLDGWCAEQLADADLGTLRVCASAVGKLGGAFDDLRDGEAPGAGEAAAACFRCAARLALRIATLRQRAARSMQVFPSVEEAVEEARRLHRDEGFDLFRGQRCDWPVVSSYRRLDLQRQTRAKERVNAFIHWTKQEAALAPYGFSSDQAIAIAQHHGLATTFIDFSTDVEVARYFATEHCRGADAAVPDAAPEPSCIVAMQSADFVAWVRRHGRPSGEFHGSEFLRLDVPNLRRIEAQAGVFVVDDDVIDDYPFHVLLFPASVGADPAKDRAAIYPENRSDLELKLDQWFFHEEASGGMRDVVAMLRDSGLVFEELRGGATDGIGLKGVTRPEVHPSWPRAGASWAPTVQPLDAARPAAGDVFRVDLRTGMDFGTLRALAAGLPGTVPLADRRRRSADWQVFVDDRADADAARRLALQWDALRIDGYADEQVLASLATSIACLALQRGLVPGFARYAATLSPGGDMAPLAALFGGDLPVEFTGLVGYGRAVVNARELQSAVRDDIGSYLPDDLYDGYGTSPAERMHRLLVAIHQPSLLFDFERFADVYVRQVVPTQAVFRPDLPLYTVMHLRTFGVT